MRVSGIKVTLELPVQFDRPDLNGITYSREAWEKAVERAGRTKNIPIKFVDQYGRDVKIGVVDKMYLECDDAHGDGTEGEIIVAGTITNGGTNEEVQMFNTVVTDAVLRSIGLSEK